MDGMLAEYGDIDWDGLTHARRALIGNPYATPQADLQRGEAWFLENRTCLPRALLGLLAAEYARDAKKLALAAAHAYARAGASQEACAHLNRSVTEAREKGLPLNPKGFVRLFAALRRHFATSANIIGPSKAMQAIRQDLWTLSFGPSLMESLSKENELRRMNVVILGETGTGKELIAEVLQASAFTSEDPPAFSINCAALPAALAESELFGFERGAHSTASERRAGKLSAAHGGTFFLDEVADLPPDVQVKLLSVIENGKVTPLGATAFSKVDIRYIAATSRPLEEHVASDKFRLDLYERLASYVIEVPPLRMRPEDTVAIGLELLRSIREREPIDVSGQRDWSSLDSVIEMMLKDRDGYGREYSRDEIWLNRVALGPALKGNVRELERLVRQYVLGLSAPRRPASASTASAGEQSPEVQRILAGKASEEEVVNWYMNLVLKNTGGNLTKTTEILLINRSTIRRRQEDAKLRENEED